jgi:hypothetical protein
MNRTLAPEWLDVLPAEDGQAVGSRRDLRRLNGFMGHPRLVANALLGCFPNGAPRCVAELGAGDGAFLLKTASILARSWPGTHAALVDRRPAVTDKVRRGFERLGWTVEIIGADIFDWLEQSETEAAAANLFLHHFAPGELKRLLGILSTKCQGFAACEPRRAILPLAASHLLGFVGCNAVTRHDAPISVRAGFRRKELSAVWPDAGWRVEEREAGLFSHLFSARTGP